MATVPPHARLLRAALLSILAVAAAVPARAQTEAEVPSLDLREVLRGEGDPLTADRAAAEAVATAPSVARAEAALRQSGAGADRALYAFIPQLGLSFRYTRLSEVENATFLGDGGATIPPEAIDVLTAGVDDPEARFLWRTTLDAQADLGELRFPILLDQYAFRATLTYPLSAALLTALPSYEAANGAVAAARAQLEDARQAVALQAREAFYNYARARGALAIAEVAETNAEARLAQVESFVEAGTAAPVDGLRLRAQLASARVAVIRGRGGVDVAANALRTLLHRDGAAPLAVAEDVLAQLPALEAGTERLVSQARRQRADAEALRLLIRSAEQQVAAAEGSRYPSLAVSANLDVANPNPRVFPQTDRFQETWDVSAILSFNLHDLLNGDRQAEEARAARDQREEDLRALEDGIRVQVVEAVTSYRAARQAYDAATLGVEAAEEGYRVQALRYREGVITATDLIQSALEQTQAQTELLDAAIDGRLARARLRRALGEAER